MGCPSHETVCAFVGGDLAAAAIHDVEEHLVDCQDCRRVVAELAVSSSTENESQTPTTLARAPLQVRRLQAGTQIDNYRIERWLGRGGMGEVYLARDLKLKRQVALKLVHPELMVSQSLIDRFIFEARATARFSHPNIVTIYAVGEYEGRPYLALEYLEGQTLRERLLQAPVAPAEALAIARAVAAALAEAHRHRVFHRDLKPGNIMLAADGRVRVLDFGLAHATPTDGSVLSWAEHTYADGSRPATNVVRQAGTPSYMAPEQWTGRESHDGKADIWALGVTLFEMLFGERPYHGASAVDLRHLVSSDERISLPPAADTLDVELRKLLARCLEKRPGLRPSAPVVAESLKGRDGRPVFGRVRPIQSRWLRAIIPLLAFGLVGTMLLLLWPKPQRSTTPATTGLRPPPRQPVGAAVKTASGGVRLAVAGAPNPKDAARAQPRSEAPVFAAPATKSVARPRVRRPRGTASKQRRSVVAWGTLIVQSAFEGRPMWARVYVDGVFVGHSPLKRRVRVGRHQVLLRRSGFEDKRSKVRVGAKVTRLMVRLVKQSVLGSASSGQMAR